MFRRKKQPQVIHVQQVPDPGDMSAQRVILDYHEVQFGCHIYHFILTVITLGAWLPIWLIHWLVWSSLAGVEFARDIGARRIYT